MQPGARLLAAMDVLDDVLNRHRPASTALSDWGRSHRFAGARDRAAIGNIVFDALRRRNSIAHRLGSDTPRALALGVFAHVWREPPEAIAALCAGERTPSPLTCDEHAGLLEQTVDDAPDWIRGDYPRWLDSEFQQAFGSDAATQGAALAQRAPIDLRVNTLKTDRSKVLKALQAHHRENTPLSPIGVRVPARARDAKAPHLEAEPGHGKGWFEVQDAGSQVATLLTGSQPGHQILDICAGAGGKTLALAAMMENKGQLYAYDAQKTRLRPIFERLKRAGVRNAQVLAAGDQAALAGLQGRMDITLVDAPCSGSGAWRRRPDAKWRLSANALDKRHAEQWQVLSQAALMVRPRGRIVYVTCSVLPSENEAQAERFLRDFPDFQAVCTQAVWAEHMPQPFPGCPRVRPVSGSLLLTPASHQTDGFFVAIFERMA